MKIGIITHYYRSINYGGNLQAYALAHFINSLEGLSAEQISYDFLGRANEEQNRGMLNFIRLVLKHPRSTLLLKTRKIISNIKKFYLSGFTIGFAQVFLYNKFKIREKAISYFNECVIPHSKKIYTANNMYDANYKYDAFITGSDQVWSWYEKAFALDFVNADKIRISYAASVALKELPETIEEKFKKVFPYYKAISVRDKTDFNIISKLTSKKVSIVLDPAFLLSASEWDEIIPKNNKISGKYVFCYLLGDSRNIKEIATKFASNKNLQFVYIPHFQDNENAVLGNDLRIKGKKLYDVSPADFVGLIKNAEYVLTDSFHAVVFSIIYHKQFFCFERTSKWGDMSSRMINLLSSINCLDRYCCGSNKENLDYINNIKHIDYNVVDGLYLENLNYSKKFLKDALEV